MVATDQLMKVMDSEVKAMVTLAQSGHHPNVVNLIEVIDDEAGFEDKLILVMEYCSGGQLLNWDPATHTFSANRDHELVDETGHIMEVTIRSKIRDVAKGLQYCHD